MEEALSIFKKEIRINTDEKQKDEYHEKIFDRYFEILETGAYPDKNTISEELEKIMNGIEIVKKSLKDFSSY